MYVFYFLYLITSPFLIFQSSVVDTHVGHPLFYGALILIPFVFLKKSLVLLLSPLLNLSWLPGYLQIWIAQPIDTTHVLPLTLPL